MSEIKAFNLTSPVNEIVGEILNALLTLKLRHVAEIYYCTSIISRIARYLPVDNSTAISKAVIILKTSVVAAYNISRDENSNIRFKINAFT